MVYVFDTSSFSVLGNYFPQSFPSFWQHFNEAVVSGDVISVREVLRELDGPNVKPHLDTWIQSNKGIFVAPDSQETDFVAEIFSVPHFLQLVSKRNLLKGMPVADPFVIAAAKVRVGCVVTEETRRPHAARIPNICDHFNVDCKTVEEFIEAQGWTF